MTRGATIHRVLASGEVAGAAGLSSIDANHGSLPPQLTPTLPISAYSSSSSRRRPRLFASPPLRTFSYHRLNDHIVTNTLTRDTALSQPLHPSALRVSTYAPLCSSVSSQSHVDSHLLAQRRKAHVRWSSVAGGERFLSLSWLSWRSLFYCSTQRGHS